MERIISMALFCLLALSSMSFAAGTRYYGADYIYEVDDIAVFWAVLKGDDVDSNLVYINVVPLHPEDAQYDTYSVVASNAFSGESKILKELEELKKENIIKGKYSEFLTMSERSILLYGKMDSKENPHIIIYYKGVPDAAPEFKDESQIRVFFEYSINKLLQR